MGVYRGLLLLMIISLQDYSIPEYHNCQGMRYLGSCRFFAIRGRSASGFVEGRSQRLNTTNFQGALMGHESHTLHEQRRALPELSIYLSHRYTYIDICLYSYQYQRSKGSGT